MAALIRNLATEEDSDEQTALAYRAELQNRMFLSGDKRGIFGIYPPAD
ncbi:hypothetical protein [Rhodococcus wratislaviensis]|nr:hypothetical protein [Rhodococcus wratislaviensis]